MTHERARAELVALSGAQFDPELVPVFLDLELAR
jgi:HD-GYP domain-containing protein (c-di-GMP phosphodiesterase class II)